MTPETPKISVLLPVRDALPWIDECLQSLAAQSFGDFEVIAVDDGSTDGTSRRLEEWERRDPRFVRLPQPALGLIPALNRGLERCRGEWVARMDADDRSHPLRFERQLALARAEPALVVVSCLVTHFPEAEVAEGFRQYEGWINALVSHDEILRERFIESPIPHPTAMVRRSALEAAGGYRDVGWPEDYDLWLRLAEAGARFGKVPERLYDWRDRPDRLTRTDSRYAVERFLACKARYLASGPLAQVPAVVVWGAGQTGRRLSKHLLRRGVSIAAFLDVDPRKVGGTLRSLPVRPVEELPRLLPDAPLVLACVSSRGARRLIREHLDGLGLSETIDYWCVA